MLGRSSDSAELAVQVLRRLASGGHHGDSDPWVVDSLMWPQYLATVLLFRGHVREAHAVYQPRITRPDTMPYAMFADPFLDLALLGAIPADEAAAWFRSRSRSFGLAWWFAQGDTLSLRNFVVRAREEASRTSQGLIPALRSEYKARAGEAYLTLLRGDSAGALRAFASLPDSLCLVTSCFHQKLTQARLLSAAGDNRAAANLLDRWRWTSLGPFFVIAALERARLAERLGERELGITLFQRVVDTWRRADPELQPYVAEARAGLQRLTKEPRP